jgi:shikimate kinase
MGPTVTGPRRGVALGGFMGVGKTTVARLLSAEVGLPVVDVDEVLVVRFGPIRRQIETEGEARFREREAEVIRELAEGPPVIVSTGGGAWVDAVNRERLRQAFYSVVLTAPLDVLRERVGEGADRPLWGPAVAALYEARRAAYADADLVLDTSLLSPAQVAQEIVACWRAAG